MRVNKMGIKYKGLTEITQEEDLAVSLFMYFLKGDERKYTHIKTFGELVKDFRDNGGLERIRNLEKKDTQDEMPCRMTMSECKDICTIILNSSALSEAKFRAVLSDKTGIWGLVIENENKEAVFAFRGSANDEDWLETKEGIDNILTTKQKLAIPLFMRLADNYEKILLTGHSKGGNIAIALALACASGKYVSKKGIMDFSERAKEYAKKIVRVDAYCAHGLSPGAIEAFKKGIEKIGDIITNISTEGDPVHGFLNHKWKNSFKEVIIKPDDTENYHCGHLMLRKVYGHLVAVFTNETVENLKPEMINKYSNAFLRKAPGSVRSPIINSFINKYAKQSMEAQRGINLEEPDKVPRQSDERGR
jgi:hypothetical protein